MPEAVAERARAAGLAVPPGATDAATLLSLICAPGFSTRDESDRASGRGVGMSVVQAAVDELWARCAWKRRKARARDS